MRKVHKKSAINRLTGFGEWETKLQQKFSTRVSIKSGKKGGTVEFEYYGDQDLERLLEAWGVV